MNDTEPDDAQDRANPCSTHHLRHGVVPQVQSKGNGRGMTMEGRGGEGRRGGLGE